MNDGWWIWGSEKIAIWWQKCNSVEYERGDDDGRNDDKYQDEGENPDGDDEGDDGDHFHDDVAFLNKNLLILEEAIWVKANFANVD